MGKRILLAATVLGALSACQEQAPQPKNESVRVQPSAAVPVPDMPSNAVPPNEDLAGYIVGAWSFESDCATDFSVHYYPNGKVENSGNIGLWGLEGDTITETITERFEMGGEPEQVAPAEVLRYTVTRVDEKHAVLTIDGRKVPIQRC
jgi:hypothetical protein